MILVEAVTLYRKLSYLSAVLLGAVADNHAGNMREAVNVLSDIDCECYVEIPVNVLDQALSYMLGAHAYAAAADPDPKPGQSASAAAVRADSNTWASTIAAHVRACTPFVG